ncbi:MAG: HAD-IA family hydrolase [Patescibacteria group bacterium]
MTKLLLFDFFNVIFLSQPSKGIVNQELLKKIDELRNKYKTGILSNSSFMLRTPFIKSILEKNFDYIFSAQDLNLSKTDPQTYKVIAEKTKIKASEIIFVDDQIKNINAALAAGCKTILFENNQQIFSDISKLI